MATTLQQLGDGVEVVQLPDGSWLITQAGDATSSTVWEWDDEYAAPATSTVGRLTNGGLANAGLTGGRLAP